MLSKVIRHKPFYILYHKKEGNLSFWWCQFAIKGHDKCRAKKKIYKFTENAETIKAIKNSKCQGRIGNVKMQCNFLFNFESMD